jgi:hypothetical protein
MDVHKESISIAVINDFGKIVMECVIETTASTILQFTDGLHGEFYVTFEDGTWASSSRSSSEPGVCRQAEFYYQQLDALMALRQQAWSELLVESKTHPAWRRLCQIPSMGPIRAAVLMSILQTPHRLRTKRLPWKYSGFGIETHSSTDHRSVHGQLERSRKQISVRGLNRNSITI